MSPARKPILPATVVAAPQPRPPAPPAPRAAPVRGAAVLLRFDWPYSEWEARHAAISAAILDALRRGDVPLGAVFSDTTPNQYHQIEFPEPLFWDLARMHSTDAADH